MKGFTRRICHRVMRLQMELPHLCGQSRTGIYLHSSQAASVGQLCRSDMSVMTEQRIDLEMKRVCIALLFYQFSLHVTSCVRAVVCGSPEKPWRSERAMVFPGVKMLSPTGNPLPCDLCANETWRKTAQQAQRAGSWKDRKTYLRGNHVLMIDLAVLHHAGICLWERPRAGMFPSAPAQHFHRAQRDTMRTPIFFCLQHLAGVSLSRMLVECRSLPRASPS